MAQRRTPRGGPGGNRRPGERSPERRGQQRARFSPAAPAAPAVEERRRRPRLTGRAAILVLVVAVLTVSYASSMRAYLQQRAHIADLKEQIAAREAAIDDLEREKQRWRDPAYVEAQARERFGYVMPGETSYVVLGEDGDPLEDDKTLPDADDRFEQEPTAWYEQAWDSVVLAGNPPKVQPPASDLIDRPRGAGKKAAEERGQ
jgi:cell division protein FtsB